MVSIVQQKLPRIEFYPAPAGEPYRPCNGSEGEFFISMWCEECDHDKVMNGTATVDDADRDPSLYCEILNRSFRSDEDLPEWTHSDDGQPKCTKFAPMRPPGEPDPVERCAHTADMFEQTK